MRTSRFTDEQVADRQGLARKRARRQTTLRPQTPPPSAANHVWVYDFVFDACADGQQLKCLTIVDEFTQQNRAIDVAGSIGAAASSMSWRRLVSLRGEPAYLRSGPGPEFVGIADLERFTENRIATAVIDPRMDRNSRSRSEVPAKGHFPQMGHIQTN